MSADQAAEIDQTTLWNGTAGQAWIDSQALLDDMFRPFELLLAAETARLRAQRVLDVGCGTGATTLAIAKVLGDDGRAVGVDLSQPMIGVARGRAAREGSRAEFVAADAESQDFGAGTFDLLVSRFGVMFFSDPARAFANLRHGTRPGGALRFITWRPAEENPFMTAAERAAGPLLALPPRRKDGPGQFSLADADQVRHLLRTGGWREVELRPLDVECAFPLEQLEPYLQRLGPLGLALRGVDEQTRSRIVAAARAAFEPWVHGGEVRYTAACWMLGATTS